VYLDDRYGLGIDSFLEQGANVHVKTNMLAIMLVAIHKGFWQADERTRRELGEAFATLVSSNGLPGSGHTRPDHPMIEWLLPQLTPNARDALQARLEAARREPQQITKAPSTISEIMPEAAEQPVEQPEVQGEGDVSASQYLWLAALILPLLLGIGIWRGRGTPSRGGV
jgi:cobaltochelatase CobN